LTFSSSDFGNLYRYTFPSVMAAAALAMCYAVRHARRPLALAVVCGTLAAMILAELEYTLGNLHNAWAMTAEAFTRPRIFAAPSLVQNYRAAQEAVPAGEKVMAAVSFPVFFDYGRNTIYNVDAPGAAGPDPGLPIRQGPAALAAYLKSIGVRYIILVDPDKDITLYSRQRWQQVAQRPELEDETFRVAYPHTLAFINDVTALVQSEDVIFARGSLRVIRLR
jgi:hypothetical protein